MKISVCKGKQNKIHVSCDGEYMFTVDAEYWFSSPYHGRENIEKDEQVNIKKDRLNHIVEELNSYLELEDILNKDEKTKLFEAKRNIKKWAEKIEADEETPYTHKLTNRLELSIVSINGNYDREYISEYVQNMNVRDALSLRRYITENEPGLDYTITVERPESLGGGSMSVFLSLDEYVFLNISE